MIQQLEQRKKDKKLKLIILVCRESQNRLARLLTMESAMNHTRLVVFSRSSGRVRELLRLDMSLGVLDDSFREFLEEDYLNMQEHEINNETNEVIICFGLESNKRGGVLAGT